jgi:hypothetical protein
MKKTYRSTFWSIETGNEYIQDFFLQGGSDSIKMNVLTKNKAKWKAIEPQVKEWVREGWMGWEREKPEWFSDNWKARVPADWVPKEGKGEWNRARETMRKSKRLQMPRLSRVAKDIHMPRLSSPKRKTLVHVREEADPEEEGAEAVRGGGRVQPVIK